MWKGSERQDGGKGEVSKGQAWLQGASGYTPLPTQYLEFSIDYKNMHR
jgi:hypothetical protein